MLLFDLSMVAKLTVMVDELGQHIVLGSSLLNGIDDAWVLRPEFAIEDVIRLFCLTFNLLFECPNQWLVECDWRLLKCVQSVLMAIDVVRDDIIRLVDSIEQRLVYYRSDAPGALQRLSEVDETIPVVDPLDVVPIMQLLSRFIEGSLV